MLEEEKAPAETLPRGEPDPGPCLGGLQDTFCLPEALSGTEPRLPTEVTFRARHSLRGSGLCQACTWLTEALGFVPGNPTIRGKASRAVSEAGASCSAHPGSF